MKTAAIIQARMRSSRLPGKVLLPILGRPMLELAIERLHRARVEVTGIDNIPAMVEAAMLARQDALILGSV